MRIIDVIDRRRSVVISAFLIFLIISFAGVQIRAEKISIILPLDSNQTKIETAISPVAAGSDSVFCEGERLLPGIDYELNAATGRLTLLNLPDCDSLRLTVFRLPQWFVEPAGNPVPRGRRIIHLEFPENLQNRPERSRPQKFNLSGNKSFSFAVGRSGEGRFSQGMNIDFNALLSGGIQVRGSVSDRIGASSDFVGAGSTTLLSELDKYFFEIDGSRVSVRGGDIKTGQSTYLPEKRIKGIYGGYEGKLFGASAGIGRPSGRFVSQKLFGVDGRQGPYQLTTGEGRATAAVPGSEVVYVDGKVLEGGSDRHYDIDYAAGGIIFSPEVLITSRSRIEIDFEAAENDYERVVIDAASGVRAAGDRFKFNFGYRRESDEKGRLRFGSYSANELLLLHDAGDNPELARRSGAVLSDSGSYNMATDIYGNSYYEFVGPGSGQYLVSFSFIGEGHGSYAYLGDAIYEYRGEGLGDYEPVVLLALPKRDDQFFAVLQMSPAAKTDMGLEYEGSIRDQNQLSPLDDGDNYSGQVSGRINYSGDNFNSKNTIRMRQEGYLPLRRLYRVDFSREWGLGEADRFGNELIAETSNDAVIGNNRFQVRGGYLKYSHNLYSYLMGLDAALLTGAIVSPQMVYLSGNSESLGTQDGSGLFEKINPAVSLRPVNGVRFDFGYNRELTKDLYGAVPAVEKFSNYRGALFVRNTILTISRRTDFKSDSYGYLGPRQDRFELSSEEELGRVRLKLGGTWLDQKQLDSDRGDLSQRLYRTSLGYSPSNGWLSLTAEYRQNRQSARTTGYRYIAVESGEGDYRLEDGQYLADPDGDYIRIREELGEATSVTVGEKSHNLTIYPGRLVSRQPAKKILSQVSLRLRTDVIEEFPGNDLHHFAWFLPWSSQSGLDYLHRRRREGYSVLLFPAFNFYLVNFNYSNTFEELQGGERLLRSNKEYRSELKQQLSKAVRSIATWVHQRNFESGEGMASLALVKNKFSAGLIISEGSLQLTPKIIYSHFRDRWSGGLGNGVMVMLESIYRRPGRGEIRFDIELRSLNEKQAFSQPEYLVTEGSRFGQSARFGFNANYDLGRSMRVTINIRDEIFEDRSAEFSGRGELVAQF